MINIVNISTQIASDYDEISQLVNEGYEVSSVLLDKEGSLGDQEELWRMFLMTYSESAPKVWEF